VPRFYLRPDQCRESVLFLTGREAHHGLKVIRLRRGEQVTVLDGCGHEVRAEVEGFDRDKVRLRVLERRQAPTPPWQITLVQALPKGKLIDSIIQKATELGVSRIVPLVSERVLTHVPEKQASLKKDKWQLIAIEAIKQCGAVWLPNVELPVTPQKFLERKEVFDLPLLASLQKDSRHARGYFDEFGRKHQRAPNSLCVWVGPEGDFTAAEIAAIQASGALPLTLGPLVLRVETAAIYCLSILNYESQARRLEKVV
jgi:16S rRNA (uracil1498-N3)-methyltransferase